MFLQKQVHSSATSGKNAYFSENIASFCQLSKQRSHWLDMFIFMSGTAKSYIFEWGNFHHSEKPSTQSLTPWTRGSEGYIWSCWHFQRSL